MTDQEIERLIVEAVVDRALRLDLTVTVWDGGDEPAVEANVDRTQILDAMFNTDDVRLEMRADGQYFGFVYFVYGNAGAEVINDNSSVLDTNGFMIPIDQLIERLENGEDPAASEDFAGV